MLHNITRHILFLLLLYLLPDFLYFSTRLHPQVTQLSFLPTLLPHCCSHVPSIHTHAHSLTHSLIQSHSLRNPDADTDTRNVSAAISGAMGRAGPREVALVYSPASLACIFIMALLWAPRRGSGPASSHSFALHQDSRIISPLTVAGCSCPTPSPVNGAQLSLLSLPPSHPASECSSP